MCLFVNLYLVFSKGSIDPGLAVLLFTNVVGLPGTINQFIQMSTILETQMVAVERTH